MNCRLKQGEPLAVFTERNGQRLLAKGLIARRIISHGTPIIGVRDVKWYQIEGL
jgi:hypothetical protein